MTFCSLCAECFDTNLIFEAGIGGPIRGPGLSRALHTFLETLDFNLFVRHNVKNGGSFSSGVSFGGKEKQSPSSLPCSGNSKGFANSNGIVGPALQLPGLLPEFSLSLTTKLGLLFPLIRRLCTLCIESQPFKNADARSIFNRIATATICNRVAQPLCGLICRHWLYKSRSTNRA